MMDRILNDLPEWYDDDFSFDEELSAGMPPRELLVLVQHAKALYGHWRQLFRLIQAALPVNDESTTDKVPEVIADIRSKIRQYIIEDLLETGAKLQSVSAIADKRVLLLEQAAVIRHNAQRIWTNLHALDMFADEDGTPVIPPEYVEVLDHELAAFRERFRRWVEVFPPDGLPDAWGLFV